MRILNIGLCFNSGYLGPGGKHDDWVAPECSGGAAGYIDRLLLGTKHLFQNSDARRVYGGVPTDPEGLLGKLQYYP
jgi:heparan-alpha-glucosaminide N-acetyltransferase